MYRHLKNAVLEALPSECMFGQPLRAKLRHVETFSRLPKGWQAGAAGSRAVLSSMITASHRLHDMTGETYIWVNYHISLTWIVWLGMISLNIHMGLSKNPEINQMVFPDGIVCFFLLSFSQALASHLHQAIHIVVSLWDVSLQPQALHLFFGNFCACKVAIFLGYTQNEM